MHLSTWRALRDWAEDKSWESYGDQKSRQALKLHPQLKEFLGLSLLISQMGIIILISENCENQIRYHL